MEHDITKGYHLLYDIFWRFTLDRVYQLKLVSVKILGD